jgi:diguanylate cyclase (GGDEF)-like protein/PAS domain S-box-containing protein
MSFSKRMMIIMAVTFTLLTFMVYSVSRSILMEDYSSLELQETRNSVQLAYSAIQDDIDEIAANDSDWAGWNETYEFIENRNDQYVANNIPDTSYQDLKLNLILYINTSGEIVYGRSYDYTNNKELPLPADLENIIAENTGLWQHNTVEGGISGIFMFNEGPMILASKPILTSDKNGPQRGALVMGRYVDAAELMSLSGSTHLTLGLLRLDDPELPHDITTMLENSKNDNPIYIQALNEEIISGYGVIKDVFGNPALALKVDMVRSIYQQGNNSLRFFLILLILFVITTGLLVMLIVKRTVLTRLEKMSSDFSLIGYHSDHSMRLQMPGNDEFTQLANSANTMLKSLELNHQNVSDNKERYSTLTENMYDLISEMSVDGRYLFISTNYSDALGYEPSDIVDKNIAEFLYPEDKNEVMDAIISLDPATLKQLIYRVVCKNGVVKWFESTGKTYDTVKGEVRLVLVSRDITERQKYEEQIRYQAFHDSLTDLPNRTLFMDRLLLALAHAKRNKKMLALIFLDLDRFKLINDTLGHEIGDRLLSEAAWRIKACVREEDTVARFGGDEFTIMLPDMANAEGAAKVAEKILENARLPFTIKGHELYLSISAGIALYPNDGIDADTLLKNADTAMYLAKEKNRNNYQFYTPELNKRIHERLMIEIEMRRAIEREEFILHYQPKINVNTGEMIGVEALVRWQHPERGLVPPVEFIPIAEETGMIVPLGEWVLRTACLQNKRWQDSGYAPVSISVNLSARQFQLQNLIEMTRRVLNETGLEAHWLELEITESIAMMNSQYTMDTLHRLKKMGIKLSIDDFGTGYSSLSLLKRFPVDKLKIDKSFVMGIGEVQDSEIIASTIIALCKSLKLDVVAEGVETEEQCKFLQKHQCSEMQGYLFSKPVSSVALESFMAKWSLSKSS